MSTITDEINRHKWEYQARGLNGPFTCYLGLRQWDRFLVEIDDALGFGMVGSMSQAQMLARVRDGDTATFAGVKVIRTFDEINHFGFGCTIAPPQH